MGRRAHDKPIPPGEVCWRYRAGESISDLRTRYHSTDRTIRRILVENGVPIRPKGGVSRASRKAHNGLPADGGLTPQQVQELRERIGYDPSWVERPEHEYDRSYDDAR